MVVGDLREKIEEIAGEAGIGEVLRGMWGEFKRGVLVYGMYYFPEHFREEFAGFHIRLVEMVMREQLLAIAAPRESSKTTILGFLYPMHCISFKKKRHIIIITAVYSKSCGILETMKKEVRDNENLRDDFGIFLVKDTEGEAIIRHPDGYETRILCKGRDQIGTIRGEKFGAYRPDLVIMDDIEDDEMVRNPERRAQLQDEIDQVVMLCGERKKLQVIIIGTILHDDSQLAKMTARDRYPEFTKKIYQGRITLPDGKQYSLWDKKWSLKELNEKEKNDPITFAKEIQNDPVSGLAQTIHKEDFRYWVIQDLQAILFNREGGITAKYDLRECRAAISCDLAWEEKRESDYGVIMPGFLTPGSDILIETYVCKKGLRPDELEEIIFSMESRLKALTGSSVYVGLEKAKLEKVMRWFLGIAMRRRNRFLLLKDLQWDGDKIQRIELRLAPRYTQHTIYHRQGMGDLENQLVRVRSAVHDDLPDAEQGLVQLLDYPKSKIVEKQKEDRFDWWRQKAIDARRVNRRHYIFGNKKRFNAEIPYTVGCD